MNTLPGAVGSHVTAPGEQLGVRCLAQGHLSQWYWRRILPPPTIPAGPEIRIHNLPLTSPTRYPLGHDCPILSHNRVRELIIIELIPRSIPPLCLISCHKNLKVKWIIQYKFWALLRVKIKYRQGVRSIWCYCAMGGSSGFLNPTCGWNKHKWFIIEQK